MKDKFTTPISFRLINAISFSLVLLSFVSLTSCRKGGGAPDVQKTFPLDFTVPIHYVTHNVESNYPISQAIPSPRAITKVEGASISIQAHKDNGAAQLRVIQLPKSLQSNPEGARILAESGAIQDCDVLLSYRPRWAAFNGYCNLQLGVSHAALATIDSTGGKKIVKTVESPLSYSSNLDYAEHYGTLDLMHIIRPVLTDTQRKNVKAWALQTLATDKTKVTFFTDYGTPYQNRKIAAPATGNLPLDLAKTVIHPKSKMSVGVYCSELVWAFLALRDLNPADLAKEFPDGSGKDPSAAIKAKINPMFQPLPGASSEPLKTPGLMQGPDVQLRALISNDAERRKFLLDNVLITKVTNPAETEGHLSTGHAMAANMFRATKLPKLREYYSVKNEDPAFISVLNTKIYPNYSPTAFFALCNLPKENRSFNYVGTVSYLPRAEAVPAVNP